MSSAALARIPDDGSEHDHARVLDSSQAAAGAPTAAVVKKATASAVSSPTRQVQRARGARGQKRGQAACEALKEQAPRCPRRRRAPLRGPAGALRDAARPETEVQLVLLPRGPHEDLATEEEWR